MKLPCSGILMLACSIAAAQVQTPTLQNDIDKLLRQQHLAGAVWTIVSNDSIECYGAGVKNLETGERITKDDQVNVGSIAKTVLALGILRLATENRLHIDDPIRKYLPDLPLANPWERTRPVTVRNLLDHTSGLSDLRLWHFFSSTSTPETPLRAFYSRNPDVLQIKAPPGSIFSYSNMGYTLLGMVIEAVTGARYEAYLDKMLLQPLGMKNSTFRFVSQNKSKQLAMGHFDNGEIAPATPIYVRPAGQFTTTAFDMGVLLRFILHGGKVNGREFIRKEFIDSLGVQTHTVASVMGLKNGYALGAVSRDRHQVRGIVHSGNTVGFHAMYYFFPDAKKAFFISHNMDSETADYEVFDKVLINHLRPAPVPVPRIRQNFPYDKAGKWSGFYVPVITRIVPMQLFDIVGSHVQVKATPEGLLLKPFQKKGTLLTTGDNKLFRAEGRAEASHLFYEDESGRKYLTTGILTMEKISGLKIILIMLSFLLGISGCMLLLVSGGYRLYKNGLRFYSDPSFWSFIVLALTVITGTAAFLNGTMSIGDKNPATLMLCLSTVLLPAGGAVSTILYLKNPKAGVRKKGFWLTLSVVQFAVLLLYYGVIPFATWKS